MNSQKGLGKSSQYVLCSLKFSHLPAPSSGQRQKEVELPSHQAFQASRDGIQAQRVDVRRWAVRSSQGMGPEATTGRWEARPGIRTMEGTAPFGTLVPQHRQWAYKQVCHPVLRHCSSSPGVQARPRDPRLQGHSEKCDGNVSPRSQ